MVNHSLEDLTQAVVWPHIDSSWVNTDKVLPKMTPLLQAIPASVTSLFGFEVPMDGTPASADFLFSIWRMQEFQAFPDLLKGILPLAQNGTPHQYWESLRDPMYQLTQGPPYGYLPIVWFEFDIKDEPSVMPGQFIGMGGIPSTVARPALRKLWPLLVDAPNELRRPIGELLVSLPKDMYPFHIGRMHQRPEAKDSVRVCLWTEDFSVLVDWIKEKYPQCMGALEAILPPVGSTFPPDDGIVQVDFSADGIVGNPSVEIHHKRPPVSLTRRKDYVAYLVEKGLAPEEILTGLDQFVGNAVWRGSLISRDLNHVKFTLTPDGPTKGKVYLRVRRERKHP